MTRVAVSGANGFVGGYTIERLKHDGHETIPLVRRPYGQAGEVVIGDLEKAGSTIKIPAFDCCVHLVAKTHISGHYDDELSAYRRTNVEGTRNALALAKAAGATRFVYMSSIKVLGEETEAGKPFGDYSPAHPEDDYGCTKYEAESLVREYCEAQDIAWTIIRPPLVYGPGVKANFIALGRLALSGLPLPLGRVDNRRSLIYVRNLADFVAHCITEDSTHNRIFTISDGEDVSTRQLVQEIGDAAGKKVIFLAVPVVVLRWASRGIGRKDIYRRLFGNLQVEIAAARATGWKPPHSLAEGLRETFAAP